MGVSEEKNLMSSNSFPTRGEFLAKTEASEMYLQPDKSIKKHCGIQHVAAELTVSLLQPGT